MKFKLLSIIGFSTLAIGTLPLVSCSYSNSHTAWCTFYLDTNRIIDSGGTLQIKTIKIDFHNVLEIFVINTIPPTIPPGLDVNAKEITVRILSKNTTEIKEYFLGYTTVIAHSEHLDSFIGSWGMFKHIITTDRHDK